MDIKKKCADTIRILSAEAIQKANSGHPGLPMGAADYAFILWTKFLKFNPDNPKWINRDRFVLSAGHGSMLLYSLLHLSGYKVSLDDLKNFRQWDSLTPGHPEVNHTPGVETTTGPLGQGFTNAVGMALAEKMLASRLNQKKEIINHNIFGIMGDGCVMEGITTEAASLAGHLKLDNIIYFYDDNKITIEGSTDLAFSEDVKAKFEALGWHVVKINGNDFEEIEKALEECVKLKGKPKLIIGRTVIGKGSPNKSGTAEIHGSPLGDEEIKLTKQALNCPVDGSFCVDSGVYDYFNKRKEELIKEYEAWRLEFDSLMKDSDFKKEYDGLTELNLNDGLKQELFDIFKDKEKIATRAASGEVLQILADKIKPLVGGSADLAPSTKTYLKKYSSITADDFSGRNLHFGIREHAMAGISNGIALYGFFIPYASTFLVFTDYARPSMRLAALMRLGVIYVMTHDSIFVGEDGPTHQPVEHFAALRTIPGLLLMRPADAIETADAYIAALKMKKNPSVLCLTRQNIPVIKRDKYGKSQVDKGAYIIKKESGREIDLIVIATGSEVHVAIEAVEALEKDGKSVRVVSMPCAELFDMQSGDYKNKILPPNVKKRASLEAGITYGWEKYVKDNGISIGIDSFGRSAPAEVLADKFGITASAVYAKLKKYIAD